MGQFELTSKGESKRGSNFRHYLKRNRLIVKFFFFKKNDLWLKRLKTMSFRLPELQSSTGKMNEKKTMRKFE